jgi:hypothetical protein
MKANNVLVEEPLGDDMLFFDCLLDGLNLVSNPDRSLEVETIGFFLHLLLEDLNELVVFALKKETNLLDDLAIRMGINLPNTRGEATVHLIVDTGAGAVPKLGIFATSQGKQLVDELKGISYG